MRLHASRRRRTRKVMRWAIRVVLFAFLAVLLGTAYKVVQINQEFAVNAWSIPRPVARATRPIYPYSVVPGGVYSVEELFDVVQKDAVVRKHYEGVIKEAVFRQTLDHDIRAHVSYRVGNKVLWTTKEVTVKAGEQVLTDGHAMIRSRCGNLLNAALRVPPDSPKPPQKPDPPEIVFETSLPPLIPSPIEPRPLPVLTAARVPPSPTGLPSTSTPLLPVSPNPPAPVLVPPIWPERHEPSPPSPPTPPITPVPEPASLVLLGTGLTMLGAYLRKKG